MILIIILIIIATLAIILSLFYLVPFFYGGIHYEKTTKQKIRTIVNLANFHQETKKGQAPLVCDLGSGDGSILKAFAKKKIHGIGYEINPILISISKNKLRKNKLSHMVKIKNKNFWRQNLRKFNIITMFQFGTFMEKLEHKIKKECKPGTIILSNHWKFPNLKPIKSKNNIHLYKL